ncbi:MULTISPECIES: hypothetical protein [Marinobacter]|uniref:hypothetical protein n=1 Tax=Marinobacter TaxID=2742 RepID=UPI000FCA63DA|nr:MULTISPECIES: hypothetical protein [Marinobacter]MCZ4285138.1 hypothetical protein [Marinobacter salarius]MDM8178283.1 hypothetical protein [Marinobacter salarius]RUT75050.1 hypothetical protein EHM94_07640 [Marinobacter sp. NP-6]VVT04194.1 conserved hypothetical protein [Marinobacter salarius]VXC19203.1 conserved hypothetical protein [Marinobacter salarius]
MIEWLNRMTTGAPAGLILAGTLAALLHGPVAVGDELPQRASDPAYGVALYEYYQGNAFEALTRLNVASAEGGIDGHGDHPALVEGGLMLSYGMTHEAGALFRELLDENAAVAPGTRNQAWFYLGKVFYLEQDSIAARDALERVDDELLQDESDELYHEWLYLRGQLALSGTAGTSGETVDELIDSLPESSPWRAYLHYNQAVGMLSEGQTEEAMDALASLDSLLGELPEFEPPLANEMSALRERVKLSIGRLHLSRGDFAGAMASLEQIALDGVFSDQALFDYAVAASREGSAGLALQALNTLQQRPLFTPWLQQVPYARGFLFEQMDRQQQALQAYREAASHYQSLSTRLSDEREQLTEARLIEALRFVREGDSPGQPGSMDAEMVRPEPGETTVLTDAYGRVKVRPGDYSLAGLLATESFQLSLRDLHELYRLRDSLGQWQTQLESFDIMLETRAQQREQRIRETRDALDALNADQWLARQAEYRSAIEDALAREDLRFFMTQEQHELADRLAQVEKTLSQLPEDESTRKQRETFQRMNAYFNWRIADDYAVNRWAAEKQLRELDRAMEVFVDQRALIEQEMASGGENQALAARVEARQVALQRLQGELDKALSAARTELLTLVDTELQQQSQEVQGYLRATRHAAARLADTLFLGRNGAAANPATEAGGDRD